MPEVPHSGDQKKPEDRPVVGSVHVDVKMQWPVWANIRSYLSSRNLAAARFSAQESGVVESKFGSIALDEIAVEQLDRHFCFVAGAIYHSVSFLEALINELLLDAVEYEAWHPQPLPAGTPDPVRQLSASSRLRMSQMWPLIERASIIDKFEATLSLADKEPFDIGSTPYQAIPVLITLRNNLVHFKPVTHSGDPHRYRKWERKIRSQGFKETPWHQEINTPFFPYKCLSHGCAEWAVFSSIRFADEFCHRMGITPPYQRP